MCKSKTVVICVGENDDVLHDSVCVVVCGCVIDQR